MEMKFAAYTDESGTGDRFTSIASFSLRYDAVDEINGKLAKLLIESNVSEFKWQKLKDAKYRHCANKLLHTIVESLGKYDARVDVIVWDNKDARHSVIGRDDGANFARMFFHLHSASLKRRPRNSKWVLFPDEKLGIDWVTVRDCLSAVGRRRELTEAPLFGNFFADPHYEVSDFRQVRSHEEPCCQIADLFAGLAVFSRSHYDQYERWSAQVTPNLGLWDEPEVSVSNREANRFQLLDEFNRRCKALRLGVSLRTRRRLHTPKASGRLNFWHYEPQHEMDSAPVRSN